MLPKQSIADVTGGVHECGEFGTPRINQALKLWLQAAIGEEIGPAFRARQILLGSSPDEVVLGPAMGGRVVRVHASQTTSQCGIRSIASWTQVEPFKNQESGIHKEDGRYDAVENFSYCRQADGFARKHPLITAFDALDKAVAAVTATPERSTDIAAGNGVHVANFQFLQSLGDVVVPNHDL